MNPRVNDSIVYACGTVLFVIKLAVAIVAGIWAFTNGHFVFGSICAVLMVTGYFGTRAMFRRFKIAKEEEEALSGIPAINFAKKK
ncbi:MAG: hypothetical protein PSV13_15365 [Lacunisphaera sp.]|nr:hypothetical protein [Lacunisphaera sp.]